MENTFEEFYEKIKNISTEIRVLGGPDNASSFNLTELDTVDADEPETFTLEELKNLVMDFKKAGKDFILARVTTPDQYRQEHLYNYYYSASEVNKLLFKYESDRRLLHRMKVRNPLNNMFIIGEVYYYIITKQEVDRAILDFYFCTDEKPKDEETRSFSAVFRTSNVSLNSNIYDLKKAKDTDNCIRDKDHTDIIEGKTPEEIIQDIQVGNLKLPPNIPDTKKLSYHAKYFATDDDFLMKTEVRDIFKANSMDPDEEFLFELDRTQNDLFALLDTTSDSENENVVGWKRVLTVHMSMLITMLGVVVLLGANPIILLIAFPLAILTLISFLCSLLYIVFFRRSTFGSLAVRSVDDV
ncbi:DUF5092 domain-containing protein [Hamiltosporidium magnivora]|uniref:DUF5092 domain-containing protein n=2 Tax=Hamiltosporidium magnivora TaxID=148818 RepID=A0A4Q9KZL2_9MICR|nr:DUF5092 domain-containing protein [Hamiltosporidium magnivora]